MEKKYLKTSLPIAILWIALSLALTCSCSEVFKSKVRINLPAGKSTAKNSAKATIQVFGVEDGVLVASGKNLDTVKSVHIKDPLIDWTGELIFIEQSASRLKLKLKESIALVGNRVFELVVDDAQGSDVYNLRFELGDGQVSAAKLSDMGASAGDVLVFSGVKWVPQALSGLTYQGSFDPSIVSDQTTVAPGSGDYYIASAAGARDPDGSLGGRSYSLGDWAVFNGATGTWDFLSSQVGVKSVAGKSGDISLVWADIGKVGSRLEDIEDVDTSLRSDGDVLVWDEGSSRYIFSSPSSAVGDITDVIAGIGLTGGATSGSATLNVDVGTGANQIVQLDGSSKLPAVDGSQLTNLPNPTTSTVLTGFTTGADSSVLNTDTLEVAIEKLQGQIDGNNTDISTNSTSLLSKVDKTTTVNGQALSGNISLTKSDIGLSNVTNDAQLKAADLDTTVTLGTSDTKVPSQAAVKSYVDTQVGALNSSQWSTSGSNIYYNSGNVGIGTTGPTSKLQVNGNLQSDDLKIKGTSPELIFETNTGTGVAYMGDVGNTFQVLAKTGKALGLGTNNTYNALHINTSGNVGIGTTAPAVELDVNTGTINAASICDENNSNCIDLSNGVTSSDNYSLDSSSGNSDVLFVNSNNTVVIGSSGIDLAFSNSPSDLTNDTFIAGSSLSVDIGGCVNSTCLTRKPKFKVVPNVLETYGTVYAYYSSFGVNDSSPDAALEVTRSNSGNSDYLMISSIDSSDGNILIVNSTGNVGIGTTSPAQKLDVNGNIALNGVTIHSSDRRLKEKVEPLRDSLDKILGISGYSYFWKDKSFDQGKQIGVIAQEVEKDFPELVTKNENTGYLAVNYNGFIGHIIEAIKSIWSEISTVKDDQSRVVSELDEIRAEIKRLKDENQKLNERISELESEKNERRDSK